ncbi:MAG: hypothetical protein V1644_01345 [Candidatus Micrarchaeota archaeon]
MSDVDKVIACFKEVGFKPVVKKFEHRIIMQKLAYLLQLKGVELGFDFSPYVRGPYSPQLAKQIFDNQEKFEKLQTSAKLLPKEEEVVQQFSEVFELKASMLEIAATYLYFSFERKENEIDAVRHLKQLKPFFSEAQVAVAISKAKQFLPLATEADREALKKELAPWQNAAVQSWVDLDEKGRSVDS